MSSSQKSDSTDSQDRASVKEAVPSKHKRKLEPATTFDQVLKDELNRINDSRRLRDAASAGGEERLGEAHEDNLIGLAFSGGGIRSATFNLGILQALAQHQLLRKFDYLSTVSGGGYIGSWLTAFTKRRTDPPQGATWPKGSFADVEAALTPSRYEPDKRSEPPVVHSLRLYSNYLTPHAGLISGDTWAMVGTWMRNTILNQTIFGMVFVSVLVLCQALILRLIRATEDRNDFALLIAGGVFLSVACISMAIHVLAEVPPSKILQNWFQRIKIMATVMLPFVLACVLLNSALWERTDLGDAPLFWWALFGAFFYLVVWGIVVLMALAHRSRRKGRGQPLKPRVALGVLVLCSPVAGAVGGCFFWAYTLLLRNLPDWAGTNWIVLVFGSGVLMAVMLLVGVFHIGLVGRGSMDVVREWWARLGGYLSLLTFGWLLLAATCVFAPIGVRWAIFHFPKTSMSAVVLWVIHNILGVAAADSPKTSGKANDPNVRKAEVRDATNEGTGSGIKSALASPKVLGLLAKVAPYVFIVGLILLTSTVVHVATGLWFDEHTAEQTAAKVWHFRNGLDWPAIQDAYWMLLNSGSVGGLLLVGGISLVAGLLLSWRVDVNEFSLHHFYRNRLVRCYLGSSNPMRRAEPFTGFDPDDDLSLCSLDENYPGPYPILSAALNITGGEELGYATRRAKSFAFTPLYCGYELGSPGENEQRFTRDHGFEPSYSKTEQGRSVAGVGKFPQECGILLGTAMAISGAAASPNMGYHTSPATAFFMALFDVRLGWWMGNSRRAKAWASTGPALGLGYLFSELLAQSDQKKKFVYLSDGGHFENLAVYELIRRRCRLIVACDGGADSAYQFTDLLGLIEKARTDFGVRIEIDYASVCPPAGSRESPKNFAVGEIYYDGNDVGILILVKASMPPRTAVVANTSLRRLPDDVWRYCDQHSTFPHQTTADQWFDELQFESYRALGEYIGCQAAPHIRKAIEDALDHPRLPWRSAPSGGNP
jgi:predicted acylesterase/phospholipase RssA